MRTSRGAWERLATHDGPDDSYQMLLRRREKEFDRWLVARDREVGARAWDQAKAAVVEFYENPALPEPKNPHRDTSNGAY